MKTSLFNLHEIRNEDRDLLVEFYAGDIFDIYSGILLLSAFRGGYFPTPFTTWGSLYERTGISFMHVSPNKLVQISENIVSFKTPENACFNKLFAIELTDPLKKNSFTISTLKSRYKEFANFLETYPSEEDESISLPLLGTGNQGISLEESITELLKTISHLKKTKLKIIRVFAKNFESIGVLNKKINELLNRNEAIHNSLLQAAIEEASEIAGNKLSVLSKDTISNLISLSSAEHASLNIFGINGRHFAESVSEEFLKIYNITSENDKLDTMIKDLTQLIRLERPYVISYLRLLQSYGNQVAHPGNPDLNHQDAAAIIIAIVRIVDFYETILKGKT